MNRGDATCSPSPTGLSNPPSGRVGPEGEIPLEVRVADWVRTRIGNDHMNPRERAMRLLEEASELAQSEGVTLEQARKQIDYVFSRSMGDPIQEAGGVAVCLLGWCASHGVRLNDVAKAEILRIERKPVAEIRGSVARKSDQDLVVYTEDEVAKLRADLQEVLEALRQFAAAWEKPGRVVDHLFPSDFNRARSVLAKHERSQP